MAATENKNNESNNGVNNGVLLTAEFQTNEPVLGSSLGNTEINEPEEPEEPEEPVGGGRHKKHTRRHKKHTRRHKKQKRTRRHRKH